MASTNVPGMHGWGNLHRLLVLGALGLSPCHGGGLRAPFLFGRRVVGMAGHTRPRVYPFPFFQRPIMRDVPVQLRFLKRPQLLTRL
jgi:hypothetical protein